VAWAPEKAPIVASALSRRRIDLRSGPSPTAATVPSYDKGYDCSGTVSYALAGEALVLVPLSSTDLLHYGQSGRGKSTTVYAGNGHTFAIISGCAPIQRGGPIATPRMLCVGGPSAERRGL
jgi:hypothetical protein